MSESDLIARISSASISGKAESIAPKPVTPGVKRGRLKGKESFRAVLNDQMSVRFSSHAQKRLEQRQISLEPAEMIRLQKAVDAADSKGARDALVLLNNKAFIVSVANRTVITALDSEEKSGKVFTNIDSAIVA